MACQRSHVHGGSRRLDDRVQRCSASGDVERALPDALGAGLPTPSLVPTVDMVAFLTPKRSKVDIVQAVGRAMRNAPGKTTGYILVPLYVEQAQGESLDAAVARAEFEEVWAVLQAMQEQDEVLDDIIHQMPAERRLTKGFSSDSRLRTRVEVLGPTLTLDNLRRAIKLSALVMMSVTGRCSI